MTTITTRALNQYEWMLLYGDKLADAIIAAGGMQGEEVDKLLTQAQPLECGGNIRQQARKLLHSKLAYRGHGNLFQL